MATLRLGAGGWLQAEFEMLVSSDNEPPSLSFIVIRKSEIWPLWGCSIIDFWGKVWVKSGAWQGRAGGFQRSCNYAEVWGKSGAKRRKFPADSSHSFPLSSIEVTSTMGTNISGERSDPSKILRAELR